MAFILITSFTAITTASKRAMWVEIAEKFNLRAATPRDGPALLKKWDNIVPVQRALYQDHRQQLCKTGNTLELGVQRIKCVTCPGSFRKFKMGNRSKNIDARVIDLVYGSCPSCVT